MQKFIRYGGQLGSFSSNLRTAKNVHFLYNEKEIEIVTEFNYLGVTFTKNGKFELARRGWAMVFCFVQKFFFWTTQELEYLFVLSHKARIFFPQFNIRLYDKKSESERDK
jgi:hypothetical protein